MEKTAMIGGGQRAGARAIRIASIPHLSLLGDGTETPANNEATLREFRGEISNLLYQLHLYYMDCQRRSKAAPLISAEILWLTKPVERQPYKGGIELYLVMRAIAPTEERVLEHLDAMTEFGKASLEMQWIEGEVVDLERLVESFRQVDCSCLRSIIREERMEPLPIDVLPQFYAFDLMPIAQGDLSNLTNTLIRYPGSAVSFSLIPTSLTDQESLQILQAAHTMSMLRGGLPQMGVEKVNIPTAEKLSNLFSYYAAHRNRPLFSFSISVWGAPDATTALSSRIVGLLNVNAGVESANMSFIDFVPSKEFDSDNSIHSLPFRLNFEMQGKPERDKHLDKGYISNSVEISKVFPALRKLSQTLTISECLSFFSLPFANSKIAAGLNVNETGRKSRTYADGIINAGDLMLGRLKTSADNEIGLRLSDLAKHMLIVGTPGSGKTTFSVGLLDRLWKRYHIPFLVIEPAKNEYRAMVQSIPDLQVFTPGKSDVSPFLFNPFVPPKNVKLQAYKSVLKTAFAAGVTMTSPLDKIFEDTVNNCYSDFRWLDSYTSDGKGKIFNISDFIKCFKETFEKIGYSGDSRNIGRAGIVRLKGLANLFDNYFSIPIEDILSKPTVIELSAIENSDEKALIIALLLLSILSYVNANYVGEGGLRNFILLEEAHVLLDADSGDKGGAANPAAIAQGLVKRMLAEIRSYGVGLAIADQSPRKVGTDIVALTDIKVAFRIVEGADKEILADSCGMTEQQKSRLAKLKPGQAFIFFNKLEEPEEIITPDYRMENKISISLSDKSIGELSTYWLDKVAQLKPYPQCAHVSHCAVGCDHDCRLLAREISRRLFVNHVGEDKKNKEGLNEVLKQLSSHIQRELNGEELTLRLKGCVKAHLLRKCRYEGGIKMSDEAINKSLDKA